MTRIIRDLFQIMVPISLSFVKIALLTSEMNKLVTKLLTRHALSSQTTQITPQWHYIFNIFILYPTKRLFDDPIIKKNPRKFIKQLLNNHFFQMNQTLTLASNQDEEPPHQDLQMTFTSMLRLFSHDITQSARESKVSQPKQRHVTSKMRNKLLSWIEKLSIETFKFHRKTFITAALIIDQYLQQVDQSPSNLQLAGCACLLIASKLKESIIVAPECYVTACCQIYSKNQLLQKQKTIYSHISFKKIRQSVIKRLEKGFLVLKIEQNIEEGLKVLSELVKKERFREWNEVWVVCAVLSLFKFSSGHHKISGSSQKLQNLL